MKRLLAGILTLCLGTTAYSEIRSETVRYTVDGTTFHGTVVWDDQASEAVPGVLVVPEWWGVTDYVQGRARQIAELGYAAFVVDMYGEAKQVNTPDEAGALAGPIMGNRPLARQRLNAALDAFKGTGHVDGQRIASIGYCFGGTMSLELAREDAPVVGVISFHGSLVAGPNDAARQGISPSVVVMHGAADPMVPVNQVIAFGEEMDAAKADWTLVAFAGAVHSFTNPEADSRGMDGVKYDAKADHRSWAIMQTYLAEWFAE